MEGAHIDLEAPGTCPKCEVTNVIPAVWFISASGSLLRSQDGWLDRMVQYQKKLFIDDVNKEAPVQLIATIKPEPKGYVDSPDWNEESVGHLLTLISSSNGTEPVKAVLRRALNPSARRFLSYPKSFKYFPSLSKGHPNYFYYHIDSQEMKYSDEEMETYLTEKSVIFISNPVEARLPSAQISVKLLKKIMEARAIAGRVMPPTTKVTITWRSDNTEKAGGNTTEAVSPSEVVEESTIPIDNGTTAVDVSRPDGNETTPGEDQQTTIAA